MRNDKAVVNQKALTYTEYKGWRIIRIPFKPLYAAVPPDETEPVLFKADKGKIKRFIETQNRKKETE